jgi:hypothetical protein
MFCYTAYGLGICSEMVLPELGEPVTPMATGSSAPADIAIRTGVVDRSRPKSAAGDDDTWVSCDEACFHYPSAGTFRMTRGREVVVEPAAGAHASELRLILLGPALAVLLHQRGLLVLHASAVALAADVARRPSPERSRGAVAFLGDKGAGKSTTAAAMHARGHGLIADDLVAVDLSGAVPHVWPGFPHLKLWPEAAASTLDDRQTVANLARVHPQVEKRSRPIRGEFPRARLPLAAIYVLADGHYEAAEPAGPQEAFLQLVRHSYLAQILQMTQTGAAHFRQVTQLARSVPVRQLVRRRDLGGLPTLARLIERNAIGTVEPELALG